jgi:membrane protease YdiL (CAAX protease family)
VSGVARALLLRLVACALVVALVIWSPVAFPQPRLGLGEAVVAGTGAGALLFAALARRVPPVLRGAVARSVAFAAPAVVIGAAGEEIVWRYAVLGGFRLVVGAAGAVALSTVAFAAAHVGRAPPRLLWVHGLTGATFGGVYVLSGRLEAAIAAHALYNLLVVAASRAWPAPVEPEPAT